MRPIFSTLLLFLLFHSPAFAQAESWLPVGDGLDGRGRAAVVHNGNLYVLEQRTATGGQGYLFVIMKWNEVAWSEVARCTARKEISSFAIYKDEFYIGGYFDDIDWIPGTKGIVRWNGTAWTSVGGGLSESNTISEGVFDMIEYKGDLYCAGAFSGAGGIKANHIAKWNGTQWEALNDGITLGSSFGGSWPYTLAVYEGDLFVGGDFSNVDSITVHGMARWDGDSWSATGFTSAHIIDKTIVYNDDLYAIGTPIPIQGTRTGTLFRWDGTTWHPATPAPGILDIRDWDVYNGEIYIAGAGKESSNRIGMARFDGTRWETLPSFNGSPLFAITYNEQLYVGGDFTKSGSQPLNHIARFRGAAASVPVVADAAVVTLYPNPARGTVRVRGMISREDRIELRDLLGTRVMAAVEWMGEEAVLELSGVPSGRYFVAIATKRGTILQQISIVR